MGLWANERGNFMLSHDFLLVERVPETIRYSDFDRSAMTRVSDDFARAHWPEVFSAIDVYVDFYGNRAHGLAYHGTSILSPAMARTLLTRLEQAEDPENACGELKRLLSEAVCENQWVIHFGV